MAAYARVSLNTAQLKVLLKGLILSPDEGNSFTSIRDTEIFATFPVDTELTDRKQTALMLAASRCNLALIGLFLRRGAYANHQDSSGDTAIHYVLKSQRPNFMSALELLSHAHSDFRIRNLANDSPLDLLLRLYQGEEEIDQYREVMMGYIEGSEKKAVALLRFRGRSLRGLKWREG